MTGPILIGTGAQTASLARALAQAMLTQAQALESLPRWGYPTGTVYRPTYGQQGCPGAAKHRAKRKMRKKMRQQSRKKK